MIGPIPLPGPSILPPPALQPGGGLFGIAFIQTFALRAALTVLGATFIVVGLLIVAADTRIGKQGIGLATNVVPGGKIVGKIARVA